MSQQALNTIYDVKAELMDRSDFNTPWKMKVLLKDKESAKDITFIFTVKVEGSEYTLRVNEILNPWGIIAAPLKDFAKNGAKQWLAQRAQNKLREVQEWKKIDALFAQSGLYGNSNDRYNAGFQLKKAIENKVYNCNLNTTNGISLCNLHHYYQSIDLMIRTDVVVDFPGFESSKEQLQHRFYMAYTEELQTIEVRRGGSGAGTVETLIQLMKVRTWDVDK